MAQLLRLCNNSRFVCNSVAFSAMLRSTLDYFQPCDKCRHLRKNSFAGMGSFRSPFICRSASGFAKFKPDNASKRNKPPWKNKKKKSSSINQLLHSDLVKVLNKRALQLLLKKEEHCLHRSLVTNFTFTDFPLHHDLDPLLLPPSVRRALEGGAYPPPAETVRDSPASDSVSAENDWSQQFEHFEKQLRGPSPVADSSGTVTSSASKGGSSPGQRSRTVFPSQDVSEIVPDSGGDSKAEWHISDSGPSFSQLFPSTLGSSSGSTLTSVNSSGYSTLTSVASSCDNTLAFVATPGLTLTQTDVEHPPKYSRTTKDLQDAASAPFSFQEAELAETEREEPSRQSSQNKTQKTKERKRGKKEARATGEVKVKKKAKVEMSGKVKDMYASKESKDTETIGQVKEDIMYSGVKNRALVQLWPRTPEDVKDTTLEEVMDRTSQEVKEMTYEEMEDTTAGKVKITTENKAKEVGTAGKVKAMTERERKEAKMLEQMMKEGELQQSQLLKMELSAYVDACCSCDLESLALKALVYHRNCCLDKSAILDIGIYNRLLRSFAQKCDMKAIRNLFGALREDGLKPNMQTYAAVWECFGHQESFDVAEAQTALKEMETEGLDIRDMFRHCIFDSSEWSVISGAIRKVLPDYQPFAVADPEPCTGPLVDGLPAFQSSQQALDKNPHGGILTKEKIRQLLETQMHREIQTSLPIKSIVNQSTASHKTLNYRKKAERLREEWRGQLTKAFDKKLRHHERLSQEKMGMSIYPYLKLFEPKDYVQCILQEVDELLQSSETYSPSRIFLLRRMSERIYSKFVTNNRVRNGVAKKLKRLYQDYADCFMDSQADIPSHRQLWHSLLNTEMEGPSLDNPVKQWPHHINIGLGRALYELIIYDLKINTHILRENSSEGKVVPAFYTIYRTFGHKVFQQCKAHPTLVQLFEGAGLFELNFSARFLPMLVPPLPWISPSHGAYLFHTVMLVRHDQSQLYNKQQRGSEVYATLDAINTLSACAWVINKPVLDIIIGVFNNKGNAALDIPPPASECPSPVKITPHMSAADKAAVQRELPKVRKLRAEMHSQWCSELYKLSIANKFRDDVFWFPHNLDFRGRTYPVPPHFNHMGNDVTRSILKFAKGKPLGPGGLDWMKIHLVNLTGFKKRCSNRERLAYANEMMPEILDSADKPMTGNKWWQTSDDPWQTLACCMEIAEAIRSPDPESFVSHLPIHQDGSCNGLQHYAALGRDTVGAKSVNLWPYDRPQDVYTDVCELVERERQKDADEGLLIAKQLEGLIQRKVIKQTVMTTVYGVTHYGAKAQIWRQLKDKPELSEDAVWRGGNYLSVKTFQCLNTMFRSARDIQHWLTFSARQVASVCQQPVSWVTPLGLKVVQPYTNVVSLYPTGAKRSSHRYEKPNTLKQKNAFPPNFVHSLDSTHMMLTALYCKQAGILFISVHDCFWTHACDIAVMNKVCRDQFVALHQQPILEDLSKQLIERYIPQPTRNDLDTLKVRQVLSNVPNRGDFDLQKVLESIYFFS